MQKIDGESEYDYGYRVGFTDIYIRWSALRHYSTDFQNGYSKGRAEIESLIDTAAQSRIFDY